MQRAELGGWVPGANPARVVTIKLGKPQRGRSTALAAPGSHLPAGGGTGTGWRVPCRPRAIPRSGGDGRARARGRERRRPGCRGGRRGRHGGASALPGGSWEERAQGGARMTEETGSGWENKALRMPRAAMGTGKMEGAEARGGSRCWRRGGGSGRAAGLAPAVGASDGSPAVLPSMGTGGGSEGGNLGFKANSKATPCWGGSGWGGGAVRSGGAPQHDGGGRSPSVPSC